MVHILQPQLWNLVKKIIGKVSKPSVLREYITAGTVPLASLKESSNQVGNSELVIGYVTMQTTKQLHREGAITDRQLANFFKAAREFIVCATEYLLKWCPLEDELLIHATWLHFEQRLEKHFNSVEYFVHRYPNIFPEMNMDKLNEEFLSYQMLASVCKKKC